MKKLLSIILSVILIITTVICVPISTFAAITTDQAIIDQNTAKLIDNIIDYGFYDEAADDYYINNSDSYIDPDGALIENYWYISAENDGSLIFNMDFYKDGFWGNNTQLVVDSYKTAIVRFSFVDEENWEIGVHADMSNDYNHERVYPRYIVDYCDYDYIDYSEIRDICDSFWCTAFEEWDEMLYDNFGMNMSCVGFYNYCSHSLGTTIIKATTSNDGKTVKKCAKCGYISTTNISKISTATLSATSYTYDGNVKTPSVTVKDSAGKTLVKNTDYTLSYSSGRKNAGKYAVKVTFKGKYSGTKTLYFTIKPKVLSSSNCTATLSAASYVYNGQVKTPSITVKYGNKVLVKGTDYNVSYSSGRKSVGKYAVKVTFKGNYSGTITEYFTINPKGTSISSLTSGSKKFTVKWKKQATQTTGYQIQYSTASNFSGAKTITMPKNTYYAKSITGLAGNKKYYVRIRTYKTVKFNGKNYDLYSSWSGAKYTTTKR